MFAPTDIQKYIYRFVPHCARCDKICWNRCEYCDTTAICEKCLDVCGICKSKLCCWYEYDIGGYDILCEMCFHRCGFLSCY